MKIIDSEPFQLSQSPLPQSQTELNQQQALFGYGANQLPMQEFIRPSVIDHFAGYELPDLPCTPIDEETGLPWCFAPNPDLPPVPRKSEPNISREGEWNHQYPRVEVLYGDNPALEGLGRLALLNLRHQWVSYSDHHEGYNPNFIGPMQPVTRSRLGATVVMGVAGYVPEFGLDFSGSRPKERKLTPEERKFLWESGQLKIADESSVRQFLFDYVFKQTVAHIDCDIRHEFLHTLDLERRIHLGHLIAAQIVERAVEPFDDIYSNARRKGLLYVTDSYNRPVKPPTHPRDLVKAKLTGGSRRFGRVFNELHMKLGSYNRELQSRVA